MLKIVPVKNIPAKSDITDAPTENLMHLYKTCQQMYEVCRQSNGIGLAAVQVGIPWKLCVIMLESGKFRNIVNASYKPKDGSGVVVSVEGCLSLRTHRGGLRHFEVPRYSEIVVTGKELKEENGRLMLVDFEETMKVSDGRTAIVFQHEIDHQMSILISDIGKEIQLDLVKHVK